MDLEHLVDLVGLRFLEHLVGLEHLVDLVDQLYLVGLERLEGLVDLRCLEHLEVLVGPVLQ